MNKGELKYKFSLLVLRGQDKMSVSEKDYVSRLPNGYASRFSSPSGTVLLELASPYFDKPTQYHFGADYDHLSKLRSKFAMSSIQAHMPYKMTEWIFYGLSFLDNMIDRVKGWVFSIKGGFGETWSPTDRYHDRLDVEITKEQYEYIRDQFDQYEDKTYRYHLLFNNCTSWCVREARKQLGKDLIRHKWIDTPNKLSEEFRRMAAEDALPEDAGVVTFKDRFENGDIRLPRTGVKTGATVAPVPQ